MQTFYTKCGFHLNILSSLVFMLKHIFESKTSYLLVISAWHSRWQIPPFLEAKSKFVVIICGSCECMFVRAQSSFFETKTAQVQVEGPAVFLLRTTNVVNVACLSDSVNRGSYLLSQDPKTYSASDWLLPF